MPDEGDGDRRAETEGDAQHPWQEAPIEPAGSEIRQERDGECQQPEPGDDPLGPKDHAAPCPRGEGEEKPGKEGNSDFAGQISWRKPWLFLTRMVARPRQPMLWPPGKRGQPSHESEKGGASRNKGTLDARAAFYLEKNPRTLPVWRSKR